jgi:GNAT superfamily N-acetyltransferase
VKATTSAWLAQPDEAEAIADLLVAFRDHMGSGWPSDNAFLASVERLLEDRDTEFLLAAPDDDAPPAGVLQLRFRFSVWKAAPDAWLEDLFVAENARRAGLGEALVTLAIERARARGARRIELDTNEANAPALALYARNGFSARSKGGGGRDLFLGRAID